MNLRLLIKRVLQICFLIVIIVFIYSTIRIKGTWIRQFSDKHNSKLVKIIDFKTFKRDEYYSLYSFEDINNINYFSFGNLLYFKQLPFKKINYKNNRFSYINSFNEKETFLKIPDSLKNKANINLDNLFLEIRIKIKDSTFIDSTFFSNKFIVNKNNNYSSINSSSKKWIIDNYELKHINGFKVLLFTFPTYAIIQRKNNLLHFYQLKKDSVIEFNVQELKGFDDLKREIKLEIEKENKLSNTNKHPHPQ